MPRLVCLACVISSVAALAAPSPAAIAKAKKTFTEWQAKMKKEQPRVTFSIDWKKVEKSQGVDAFKIQLLDPVAVAFKELQSDDAGRTALATITKVHLVGDDEGEPSIAEGRFVLPGSGAMAFKYRPSESIVRFLEMNLVEPEAKGGLSLHQRRARLLLEQEFASFEKAMKAQAPGVTWTVAWENVERRENVAQIARAKWLSGQVLDQARAALTQVMADDLGRAVVTEQLKRVHFTCRDGGETTFKDGLFTIASSPNMTEGYEVSTGLAKVLTTSLVTTEPTLSVPMTLADRRALASLRAEFAAWEKQMTAKVPGVSYTVTWENVPRVKSLPLVAESKQLTKQLLDKIGPAFDELKGPAGVKKIVVTLSDTGDLTFVDGTLTFVGSPHPDSGHWQSSDLVKVISRKR
jgi:hypothetical protein